MPFPRFLNTISKLFPAPTIAPARLEALSRLDTTHIYIENIRSVLNVTTAEASKICESAYREGLFDRGIEVRCADGVIAFEAKAEQEIPRTVHCWTRENGHLEEVEIPTQDLEKVSFYILNE